jgi:hypothetical protein
VRVVRCVYGKRRVDIMELVKEVFEGMVKSEEERRREAEAEKRALLYLMSREIDAERESDPFWGGF